jgi:hypothetical protein
MKGILPLTLLGTLYLSTMSTLTSHCSKVPSANDQLMNREERLRGYEHADPARDLRAALKKGDSRFLAISGYGLEVPGVPNFMKRYGGKHSYRILEGTSDMVSGEEGSRLQKLVEDYAERYNKLLIKHLTQIGQWH